MYPVRADLKAVFNAVFLPCGPPIRRNTPNVECEVLPGRGLRRANVTRTVDTAGKVQMLVPHRVGSQPCHILRQTTLDDRGSSGRRCHVASDKGEAPSWGGIPKVLHGWVVV